MNNEIQPYYSSVNPGKEEIGLRLPYDDSSETIEIPQEDIIIGDITYRLFRRELKRLPRWNIDEHGIVTVTKSGERIAGLENERISDMLARLISEFKVVENALPDYGGEASKLTRNNMGLYLLNAQWVVEESNHILALESILEQTGRKTIDQTIEDYYKNLKITWKLPFPTARQVVAHAAFQEMYTYLAYNALEKRAIEEDAPITAEILKYIAQDELYHWSGYTKVMRIYYDRDQEETIGDVLHVAKEFRMPREKLHPNQRQWGMDLARVGAYNKPLITEQVMLRTLEGFGFIPKDLACQTADGFFKKRNPKYQTARDAR